MSRCDIRHNKNGVALVPNAIPLSGYGDPEIEAGTKVWTTWPLQLAAMEFNGVITMTFLKNFLRDESGASAAEYALILAIVGAGIAVAAFQLGGAITNSIGNAEAAVEACAPLANGGTNTNCGGGGGATS